MILPIITFTEEDLENSIKSFTQEDIVKRLRSQPRTLLHYVDVALYKIKDNDYVIIKCINNEIINQRISKDMALELLKQHVGRIL